MSGSKYVPSNNIAFCAWAKIFVAYAAANHERWGVEAPEATLVTFLEEMEALANLCTTPKCTAEDFVRRNTIRKDVEREIRSYLQGMVMRNKHVTDVDRTAMGLPLRDTKPTPVGDPVGQAEADIVYPGRTQLMLHIRHVAGTPADPRANYGCRIYYGVFAAGQPMPVARKELRESRFTRLKKELFDFEQNDSGKTACFCIRYENNRGKAGAWGPMISAVIP
jgi:hypothetical protein